MPVDTITVQTTIEGNEFGLDTFNRPVFRGADGKQYAGVLHDPATSNLIGANGALVSGAGNNLTALQHYNLRLEQTTFGGYSWQTNFELPTKASAIQIAVAATCVAAGGATIDAAAIAATSTLSTAAPTGAFNAVTFDRAAAFSQPVTGFASVIPLKWSDWATVLSVDRSDTPGAFPAYTARLFGASTNTVCTGPGEVEAAYGANPLTWKTSFKSGNFVTSNQAGYTSPGSPNCGPLFAVRYIPEGARLPTAAEFNDSISIGLGITGSGTQGLGPLTYACQAAGFALAPYLSGQSGRSSPNSLNAYLDVADQLAQGTVVIFRPYSRNGYGANQTGMAKTFIQEAFKRGHRPVLQTGFYESANTGNNVNMVSVNAQTRAIAAAAAVPVIDLEPLITAANAATMLQVDGIHPSAAGRTLLANSGYLPVLLALRS